MARVNVEEVAFGDSRLARFERLMGWDRRQALGCLVLLWHDSQELLRVAGTADEIAAWTWAKDKQEAKLILDSLIKIGYISHNSGLKDLFLIHGNEIQIEHRIIAQEKSKKGGEMNRLRWDKLKASSYPQASQQDISKIAQYNTRQDNAEQDSTNISPTERGDTARPRAPYSDLISLWNENKGTLAGIERLTESRKVKIRARWAEHPHLTYWSLCVQKMAASKFCCESGWATFDWLMKNDTNHTKVTAGNYGNREASKLNWEEMFEKKEEAK